MSKPKGHFFAIDRRAWARVCGLGLNPAVAYVVLAWNTGRDNRTTRASTSAVERYTNISRRKAKEAIASLVRAGLVSVLEVGARPKYRLVPYEELPRHDRPRLSPRDKQILQSIREGLDPRGGDRTRARRLVREGWLREDQGVFLPRDEATAPEWLWLPNTIVTGVSGETPPLEIVRQIQDPMALRLFLELYFGQALSEDGGIDRRSFWRKYERVQVGQSGEYVVWGFRDAGDWVAWDHPWTWCHRREPTREERLEGRNDAHDFFRRSRGLLDAGVIELVPSLFDGDGPDAMLVHPCGGPVGAEIGRAAERAATSLLTEGQIEWAEGEGLQLVPVLRHMSRVSMVGVYRLRYRPWTGPTAAWWGELQDRGRRWIELYEGLREGRRARLFA